LGGGGEGWKGYGGVTTYKKKKRFNGRNRHHWGANCRIPRIGLSSRDWKTRKMWGMEGTKILKNGYSQARRGIETSFGNLKLKPETFLAFSKKLVAVCTSAWQNAG